MKQLKRIYNFNFVADSAISASASPAQSAAARAETQEPERDHGLLQLRPPRRGRPGWRGSGGGREPSVCFRCDRSGHLAMECPDTADRGSRSGGSVCCRLVQSLAANDPSVFTIKEKAPIRSFSWLKAPNLRHFEDTLLNGNPW